MLLKLAKLGLLVYGGVIFLVCLCIDVALLPIRSLINIINMTRIRCNGERSMHEIVAEELRKQFTCISIGIAKWKLLFKNIMHLEELIPDDEAK